MKQNIDTIITDLTGGMPWRFTDQPMIRREAHIHHISTEAFQTKTAVKIFTSVTAQSKAERLHQQSQDYTVQSQNGMSVPQIYASQPEQGAVAMEWIEGVMPADIFLSIKGTFPHCRSQAIKRMAQWLHWFHGCHAIVQSEYDVAKLCAKLKTRFLETEQHKSDPLLKECLEILLKRASHVQGEMLDTGCIHGDFTPYNILFTDSRTLGIDFSGAKDQPLVLDICRILVSLCVHRLMPVSDAMMRRYGCHAKDLKSFCAGYHASTINAHHGLFLYAQLWEVVRRLLSVTRPGYPRAKTVYGRIKRKIELSRLKRLAKCLLETLERDDYLSMLNKTPAPTAT